MVERRLGVNAFPAKGATFGLRLHEVLVVEPRAGGSDCIVELPDGQRVKVNVGDLTEDRAPEQLWTAAGRETKDPAEARYASYRCHDGPANFRTFDAVHDWDGHEMKDYVGAGHPPEVIAENKNQRVRRIT